MSSNKANVPKDIWHQWWSAPAKLNLCLHILGQRQEGEYKGYHELETIFQLIDLSDQLRFTPRDDKQIVRLSGIEGIDPEDDLCIKAAKLLAQGQDIPFGISVECKKHIPSQAGLGGGSSDAATTLLALNHLWNLGLSQPELMELGTKLGADVPVFIQGNSAYARGIGEQLEPIVLPERKYLVVKPNVDISTRKIFQHPRLTRDTSAVTIRGLLESMHDNLSHLSGHNDCQKIVCMEYPEIGQLIDFLSQFGEARLTGTGSAVFLACMDEAQALHAEAELKNKRFARDWQTFVVNGVNQSPLLHELS